MLIALLGAPRLAYRLFKDRGLDHILERAKHPSVPVLLISTKDGADTFIREMMRDPRAVYRVVGVLSDTPSRVGREIYRVPVLGTIDALEAVVERLDRRGKRPQKLIITAQNFPGEQVRKLLERADAWRYRSRVCQGSPIFGATSTTPNALSSRSRSRICWAARRRCSTATGWRG